MPQYDVFVNPSSRSRDFVPYVVDVQSHLLSDLRSRLTLPLSRVGAGQTGLPRRLVPSFVISGERLCLLAHAGAAVDARHLRDPVVSLTDFADVIRDALDAVVSGI